MHVPDKARETEDVTTFRHAGCHRRREANRTARRLSLCRAKNLHYGIPRKVDVGIDSLCVVLLVRSNYEAVVGVDVACLVDSMVAGSETPCRITPLVPGVTRMILLVVMRSRRERKVHEVGDGLLSLAVVEGPHCSRLRNRILVCQFGSPTSLVLFSKGLAASCLRCITRRGSWAKATRVIASLRGDIGSARC